MKTRIFLAIVAALTISFGAFAAAETPPPPGPPPQGPKHMMMERGEKDEAFMEKIKERVFTMMSWELTDELSLSPESEAAFLKQLRVHFDERHALARQHHETMGRLSEINESGADSAKIKDTLDTLDANRKKMIDSEEKFFARVKEILTPQQQAKFAVAWPRCQRNLIDKVRGEKHRRMMDGEEGEMKPGKMKKGGIPAPEKK